MIFGPANGYQLRRELLSWEVERWAQLNPGSIYSMLATLEKQGAVLRHDLAGESGGRVVAVYTASAAGEAEFRELVRAMLADVHDAGDTLPFRVALNFAPFLARGEVLDAITTRIRRLWDLQAEFDEKLAALGDPPPVPPIVLRELDLERTLLRTQLDWLIGLESDVRGGALAFAGEPGLEDWRPAADDPGWRMVEERERYLDLIRREG